MDIVSRVQSIVLRPKAEWPVIAAEPASVGSLYTTYLIPLAAADAVARVVGMSLVGISIPFVGRIRVPITSSVASAVVGLVAVLVGVYLWALIINALAPTFGGRKDMVSALKLATYSATPALLAGLLSVLPALFVVAMLASLYGLYLLYVGFPVLMSVQPDRAGAYTAATVVSGVVLSVVFSAVVGALGLGAAGLVGGRVASDAADEQSARNIAAGVLGAAGGNTDESRRAAAALVAGAVAAGRQAEAAPRSGTAISDQSAAASAGAAVAALGAMASGGKAAVDPVAFQTLEAMLPGSVGPLARTHASGEKSVVAGVSTSTAEGTYGGGGAGRVTVKISDMGNLGGVMAIGRMAFAAESENDGGFEKNVMLNGQKVHETWTASGQSSELTAFVGERFMVEVHGAGVDLASAERAITSMDLGRLAAAR